MVRIANLNGGNFTNKTSLAVLNKFFKNTNIKRTADTIIKTEDQDIMIETIDTMKAVLQTLPVDSLIIVDNK